MDFVETSMSEMLHKIKLMMIKDAQTLVFDNPFSDSVVGAPLISDALMRDEEENDWIEDDDNLDYNAIGANMIEISQKTFAIVY